MMNHPYSTYPYQHQYGTVYDIFGLHNIKIYIYYVFKIYMYYIKEHWRSLTSSWPDDVHRRFLTAHEFLKKRYIHKQISFKIISYIWSYYNNFIYMSFNVFTLVGPQFPNCSSGWFLIILSFTEHIVWLTFSFSPISGQVLILCSMTWWTHPLALSFLGDSLCSYIHWTIVLYLLYLLFLVYCFIIYDYLVL